MFYETFSKWHSHSTIIATPSPLCSSLQHFAHTTDLKSACLLVSIRAVWCIYKNKQKNQNSELILHPRPFSHFNILKSCPFKHLSRENMKISIVSNGSLVLMGKKYQQCSQQDPTRPTNNESCFNRTWATSHWSFFWVTAAFSLIAAPHSLAHFTSWQRLLRCTMTKLPLCLTVCWELAPYP